MKRRNNSFLNQLTFVFISIFFLVVLFFLLYQYVWRDNSPSPYPTPPQPVIPFSGILNDFAQTVSRKDLQQNSQLFHIGATINFFGLMSWLAPPGPIVISSWINQMDVMQAEFITNHMTLTNQHNIASDRTDVIGFYTYTLDSIGNTTNLPTIICSFIARFVFLNDLIFTAEVLENATCTFLWYSSAGVDGDPIIPMTKRAIPDITRWNILLTQISSLLAVNQRNIALSICNTTQFLTLKAMFDPFGTDPNNPCNSQSLNTELTVPLMCSGNGGISTGCLPDSYEYLQVTTLNVTNFTCPANTTIDNDTCFPQRIATINVIPPFETTDDFTIIGGPGVAIEGLEHGIMIKNLGVLGVVFLGLNPILNATFVNQILFLTPLTQHANTVYAGPLSGSPYQPTFRQIISDDIANVSVDKIYGILPVENGGTGSGTTLTGARFMVSTYNNTIVEGPSIFDVGNTTGLITAGDGITITLTNGSFVIAASPRISSVSLNAPLDIFLVTSGLITNGPAALSFNVLPQFQNTFWAGPINSTMGDPSFREIAVEDLPYNIPFLKITGILPIEKGGTNSGTSLINNTIMISYNGQIVEASIINGTGITTTINNGIITINNDGLLTLSLDVPLDIFAISGSPTSGNTGSFVITKQSQLQNTFWAAPNNTNGIPLFRFIYPDDLPSDIPFSKLMGILPISKGGTNSGTSLVNNRIMVSNGDQIVEASIVNGTGITTTVNNGIITVNNDGLLTMSLSVPSDLFLISGSPTTGNIGSFVVTKKTQAHRTFLAGPIIGPHLEEPVFRTIHESDLPELLDGQVYIGSNGVPSPALIQAGVNINITYGPGTIIISSIPPSEFNETTGTVTQVGLSLPVSVFQVTNSIVTTTGTLTAILLHQDRNLVWAGPPSGIAEPPEFRSLVEADLPILGLGQIFLGTGTTTEAKNVTAGTGINIGIDGNGNLVITATTLGTVSSVGLTVPTSILSVTPSSITSSGTFAITLISQLQNTFFASPDGSSGVPTFRGIVIGDFPQLLNGQLYIGSTGSSVVASTLTAGYGINITNAAGSIIISTVGLGTVDSVGLSLPTSVFSVTIPTVTTSGTLTAVFQTQSANTFFASPDGSSGVPTFRGIVIGDFPQLLNGQLYIGSTSSSVVASTLTPGPGISIVNSAGSIIISCTLNNGTVTFVGLSLPVSVFSVTISTVTSAGTLTAIFQTQSPNTFFAGPSSGGATTPTFRSIVLGDFPPLGNGQIYIGNAGTPVVSSLSAGTGITITPGAGTLTVTNNGVISVSLSLPVSVFSVTISTVTTSGTLTAIFQTQSANTLFAGPTSGGSATPAFRTMVFADMPALSNGQLYIGNGGVPIANTLTAGFGISIINGAGTIMINATSSGGSVTSVGLNLPNSVFNTTTSLVTTSGTLTSSFVTQIANTVFAGPVNGSAAVPTFRALDSVDIPAVTKLNYYEVSSTTTISGFSSGAFTVTTTMTVTPVAGTYQVTFSASARPSNTGPTYEYAIFNGVTQLLHSTRSVNNLSGILTFNTQGIVVANGSTAITIQWRKSAGGAGTIDMFQRSMFLLRIA
jgi:hypothetical protein